MSERVREYVIAAMRMHFSDPTRLGDFAIVKGNAPDTVELRIDGEEYRMRIERMPGSKEARR